MTSVCMMKLSAAPGVQISVANWRCSGEALKTDILEAGDLNICRLQAESYIAHIVCHWKAMKLY